MIPPHRVFCYDGLRVAVESADVQHLTWLEEFLSPAFGVDEASERDVTVRLVTDARQFERLEALASHPADHEVDVFALDQRVLRMPAWNRDGMILVKDDGFAAFYEVSGDRRAVTLVARPGDPLFRTPLMRTIRELAMNDAQRAGHLMLHAASVAIDGRGVIIAGPRNAGKTSMMLQMLREPAARYLSNDRARVAMRDGRAMLRGMPTIVTIRPGTLAMFPRLAAELQTRRYHHRFSVEESAGLPADAVRPGPDGRIGVSPAQLSAALAVQLIDECPASVLLFPAITGAPGAAALHAMSPTAAAARLAAALFGVRSWKKTSDLFSMPDAPPAPSDEQLMARCSQLTASVPSFECRVGTDAYAAPMMADLLEDVLG